MTSTVNANFSDVASKVTPAQGMSIADMLNMARSAQAYQQAQQTNPLALREQEARTELAEKTLKPQISAKESEAKRLALEADKTGVDVKNHYANIARGVYGGLLTDPDFQSGNKEKMIEKLEKAKGFLEDVGIPTHESKMHDQLKELVSKDPKQAFQMIKNGVQQAGTNAEQFGQVNAPATYVDTGQMKVPVYQSPYQGGGPGNVPVIQNQLPPTTPVTNAQGQAGYLGPMTPTGNQFVAAGLGPAQTAALTAPVEYFTKDWNQTQEEAKGAQSRIGLLQNINTLADKAFTGVGGARKELAAGVANAVGIPLYEAEKTATDELAKNSAVLQMAGGNTDAARAIAEAMSPNKKMNREAIRGVVNQLIGTETFKQRKQDVLSKFINDPVKYTQISQQINSIDPKVFQEMSPEQVANLKKNMSPEQRANMSRQIQLAKSLGMIQ